MNQKLSDLPKIVAARSGLLMAFSNGLAMGSSFFLYLRLSSVTSLTDFARFGVFVTVVTLAQQLADLNSSQLTVREASKAPQFLANYFKWLLYVRFRRLVLILPILTILILFTGGNWGNALLAVTLVCSLTLYSSAIAIKQSEKRFGAVFTLQALNASGFGLAIFLLIAFPAQARFDSAVLIYSIAYFPCTILAIWITFKTTYKRRVIVPKVDERRNFSFALLLSIISINLPTLALGYFAPIIGASYLIYLQPAMVFTPVAYAMTTTLLPTFSSQKNKSVIPSWFKLRFAIAVPLAGIALSYPAYIALSHIYAHFAFTWLPLALTCASSSSAICIAVISAWQISQTRSREVRNWLALQTSMVLAGCLLAILAGNFYPVLFCDLAFRALRITSFFVSLRTDRLSNKG
jgi:hypothetical protein